MTDINAHALDRELKRGFAELLILSLLDARQHGDELSRLIHTRSIRSAVRRVTGDEHA